MDKRNLFLAAVTLLMTVMFTSCKSEKSLIVPRSVSTVSAIPMAGLNLAKGDYEILNTVTETAGITAKYDGYTIKIQSTDGDFAYTFRLDGGKGWTLASFKGTASFGYLMTDMNEHVDMPDAEEFARRVAISRLIDQVKDYGGDGVLEPVTTCHANNVDNKTVEYTATVSAKIVKIHPTAK